jgi:predicted acyl esterase
VDNAVNRFLDDEYYASKDYNMGDIKVPLLSVGNWGGILLHLRGNVEGYMNAGSKLKYLRFVTGRHDLPFYSEGNVELQKSFLDAFLKDRDTMGWSTGEAPKVGFVVRKGDVGFNDTEAEKSYPYRFEEEWPLPDTVYTRFYLTSGMELTKGQFQPQSHEKVTYRALGDLKNPQSVHFTTKPLEEETEFTGHIVVHLNVSASKSPGPGTSGPTDIDLFITLRHLAADGHEILYTGTVGDPVPITKGWLRVSLRKINEKSPRSTFWHPHREYLSTDEEPIVPGEVYPVDIEVWPTNVVVEAGGQLVLEVSSGDTQGAGLFEHNSVEDRSPEKLEGMNHIHFGAGHENWLLMPIIPAR